MIENSSISGLKFIFNSLPELEYEGNDTKQFSDLIEKGKVKTYFNRNLQKNEKYWFAAIYKKVKEENKNQMAEVNVNLCIVTNEDLDSLELDYYVDKIDKIKGSNFKIPVLKEKGH